jgi:DNA mismatch repair protein MutL
MPLITILPETLSNKIAAGEVVERPASAVKELVENAIDAKSTSIRVEVNKGGRALIRVADNGVGMDRDDALLSIERHATSKIHDEKDLFSIATLGFRGEALPSIASVSEMEIVTRCGSADKGTRIFLRGGTIKEVSDIGAPPGTMVTVHRLFFNTPARRKFLKSDRTEMGHISDTMTRFGLAWPGIQFKFVHNGKAVANWGNTKEHLHRVVDVLNAPSEKDLYPMHYEYGKLRIGGFLGSPDMTRKTARSIYVYVNGRLVKDKMLYHAIGEGYAGRLMKGDYPMVVLFLALPPCQVDVNVHPTKSAVRFQAPKEVYDAVKEGIRITLAGSDRLKGARPVQSRPVPSPVPYVIRPAKRGISEPSPTPASAAPGRPIPETPLLWEARPFSSLRVVGQIHQTYIVCESEDGLVLVDQHAAHERVLFESLKAAFNTSDIVSQGMLIPERLELSYREADILDPLLDELRQISIHVEPFGGRTYLVRAVPPILAGKPIKPVVMEIIDKVAEMGIASGLHGAIEECLAIMACHGAIRAKEPLSQEQMKTLLKQLDALDHGGRCPHGRPTFILRSMHQIEKDFGRIV